MANQAPRKLIAKTMPRKKALLTVGAPKSDGRIQTSPAAQKSDAIASYDSDLVELMDAIDNQLDEIERLQGRRA